MLNFCGYIINWQATGAMISGLGSWFGSGAVLFAAYKGTNVFRDWKRQKITERRMDLAEQILGHAYHLQSALIILRRVHISFNESRIAEQQQRDVGSLKDELPDKLKQLLLDGQIYRNRFEDIRQHVEDLNALMPRASALFGYDVTEPMSRILHIYNSYRWHAIKLPEAFGRQTDGMEQQCYSILRTPIGEDITDRYEEELREFITALNNKLIPILRDHD